MNPSLPDPIVDLLRNHAEFPSQVRNPPFVLPDQVVAKQFSHQAQVTHQRSDPALCENATTARWNETLVVEFSGDLRPVKSLLMELRDSFREAPVIFQLLISADWSSDLVLGRKAAVPNNRHLVELGRFVGHDDHALHHAAHDLLAIERRRRWSVPERGDALGKCADSLSVRAAQGRRELRQEPVVVLPRLTLLL